jgi:hypothetical protein
MEELQKQIIAIQLIQELIVDKCDEAGIFSREDFEIQLQKRVDKFNKDIEKLKKEEEQNQNKPTVFMGGIVGEA